MYCYAPSLSVIMEIKPNPDDYLHDSIGYTIYPSFESDVAPFRFSSGSKFDQALQPIGIHLTDVEQFIYDHPELFI